MTELRGYAKGRERREEILAAADAAFGKHGFRGASPATIAQQVGLCQRGVLHHFPSKKNLLLEVLCCRDERHREWVAPEVGPRKPAVQVPALFDGLQLQWLLEPDAVHVVEVLRAFLARLD